MKATVFALVTAAVLAPAAGFAQATPSMLALSVGQSLAAVGIDAAKADDLTLSQLTKIKAILEDDENTVTQRSAIEAVVNAQ